MLHLRAIKFFWKFSRDGAETSKHINKCRRRLENYLNGILWANQGMLAPSLNTLIFADDMPVSCLWDRSIETSKERLEGYIQVFEKLQIGVGKVVTEIHEVSLDNETVCPVNLFDDS